MTVGSVLLKDGDGKGREEKMRKGKTEEREEPALLIIIIPVFELHCKSVIHTSVLKIESQISQKPWQYGNPEPLKDTDYQ